MAKRRAKKEMSNDKVKKCSIKLIYYSQTIDIYDNYYLKYRFQCIKP